MTEHKCDTPNCQGLHGSLADLITAYEQKDPPFEEDTAAQKILRQTFPVPVVVSCGALISLKVIGFIEDIATAETTKDAANVLHDFLESKELVQLTDFAETMMMIRDAWEHCYLDKDGSLQAPDEVLDEKMN
tara:strand:- start:430 stop:825 length:396 start_codon:yes stop_codon:yes gene_type:complete